MQVFDPAHGYSDGDVDTNHSENRHLFSIISERLSRRQTLFGGLTVSATAFLGTSLLTACSEGESGVSALASDKTASAAKVEVGPPKLTFTAVAKNVNDVVTVPAGYNVTVMTRVGDPLAAGVPDYANDGTDTDFAHRVGDHGEALY